MAKKLSNTRNAVIKRLKRRGIITNPRGISTEELYSLWDKHQFTPTIEAVKKSPLLDNFETVKNILDIFAQEYKDYFIGWYRDAWRYLDDIEHFWRRLDKDKINNDENFVPVEVHVFFFPPSDWNVNEQFHLAPEDIPDYLEKLYDNYIR